MARAARKRAAAPKMAPVLEAPLVGVAGAVELAEVREAVDVARVLVALVPLAAELVAAVTVVDVFLVDDVSVVVLEADEVVLDLAEVAELALELEAEEEAEAEEEEDEEPPSLALALLPSLRLILMLLALPVLSP